ncbi:hypothetical protein R1sor_007537 [Riccia sorocarpa]|uniref:DDE-1 domain-containing protein n=1 Tax=Riccia sorocarpa TaxID=122646 RepID=A0ABD3HSF9_9MARC
MGPRVELNHAQRIEICKHHIEQTGISNKAVSVWASHKFNVKINEMTFSRILKKRDLGCNLAGKEKALLLLDNFAGHKIVSIQSEIRIIPLAFFPPNVTAIFQPLNSGNIRAFKAHYRKYLVADKLHQLDLNQDPEIDVYEAVHIVEGAWSKDVSSATIRKCWRHSKLVTAHDILPDLNEDTPSSDGIRELAVLLD